MWWRELYGSDENLDDNHLMRMAGRFSRRLRGWAKANGVPVVYCSPGDDKHKMAEQHLATHETSPGLFLILVSKAPALVWEAEMTGTGVAWFAVGLPEEYASKRAARIRYLAKQSL